MATSVKITQIKQLTHDVIQFTTEKPSSILYHCGQAADVSIHKKGWENELRAFTFTSLPSESFLEFIIKIYPNHEGVTNQLQQLKVNDELLIGDVFGEISYRGEGIFIAGGAGITPFYAIMKELASKNQIGNNRLIFANKTKADIILESTFNELLSENFIPILSDEMLDGYEHGFVSADLISKIQNDRLKYYYLCGPDPMMNAVEKALNSLGISPEYIVREAF